MKIGILILAAGRSTRFGSDKRLATLGDGQSVIEATLANLRQSNLPFLFCLRSEDEYLASLLDAERAPYIHCSRSAEGMGGTLAEGAAHIPDWNGVIVALADMPWIPAATYNLVARQLSEDTISLPVFNNLPGHPVGFGCNFYEELRSLKGDTGARMLLKKHPQHIQKLDINEPAIHQDVDRPSNLQEHKH